MINSCLTPSSSSLSLSINHHATTKYTTTTIIVVPANTRNSCNVPHDNSRPDPDQPPTNIPFNDPPSIHHPLCPIANTILYKNSLAENIYDQIPAEQFYDAPYEMRTNEEVYEPEPAPPTGNVITINGISVR